MNNETVLIIGSLGMLLLSTAIIGFIYLYQRKLIKRKLAYQKIEDLLKHQELKSAYALLEGQDLERQRIAEEIHDNLGSAFVTLSMYADALGKSLASGERQRIEEKIGDIARQAIQEVRKISHRLDSGALHHFGLKAAVMDLVSAINESGTIAIELNLNLSGKLTNEISINLYRILQEFLNNTLKHAEASKIAIEISQITDKYISFVYEDDGIGFSMESIHGKGMGLRNIRARVEKLNGQISFEKKPTNGFSAVIEIPLS